MKVLVIDVGGTHVKILLSGESDERKFVSGPKMTPEQMVDGVLQLAANWKFEVASIGYPGPVWMGRPVANPFNLGPGWVGFNFDAALGCKTKIVNDAAMQALGSYEGGKMLFLGLGTGLGSAMIDNGMLQPMELGHLPYRKRTFEDYVGVRGLEKFGKKKWRHYVADVIARFDAALEPDYIVIGGGNARRVKDLPKKCRLGDNANAFRGGFRLWDPNATAPVVPANGDGQAPVAPQGDIHQA